MAIIKCSECNNSVSDKASVCPKCGFPLAKSLENSNKKSDSTINKTVGFSIVLLIFAVVFLIYIFGTDISFFWWVLIIISWMAATGQLISDELKDEANRKTIDRD